MMHMTEIEQLDGGSNTKVWRDGDSVLRSMGPSSQWVQALLRHLERVGYTASPRFLEICAGGIERLEYIEGDIAHPAFSSAESAHELGVQLRALHTASSSFDESSADWEPWFGRGLGDGDRVIGHCDLGPWNVVETDTTVRFIDWDIAGPVDPSWEVAQACWLNAQLHDDDVAAIVGLPDATTRAGHARLILDGYGAPRADRPLVVDRMIEFAVHAARDEAVRYNVSPESPSAIAEDGFPIMWGIAWRARAASWMIQHRSTIDRIINR